jgi:hypothetical protein
VNSPFVSLSDNPIGTIPPLRGKPAIKISSTHFRKAATQAAIITAGNRRLWLLEYQFHVLHKEI